MDSVICSDELKLFLLLDYFVWQFHCAWGSLPRRLLRPAMLLAAILDFAAARLRSIALGEANLDDVKFVRIADDRT